MSSKAKKAFVFDGFCLMYLLGSMASFLFSSFSNTSTPLFFLPWLILGFFCFVTSFFLVRRQVSTLGRFIFLERPQLGKGILSYLPQFQLGLITLWSFVLSIYFTEASFVELLDAKGFSGAMNIFSKIIFADWSIIGEAIRSMIETVFVAFLATALAIPIAYVLSFFCAKNIMAGSASDSTSSKNLNSSIGFFVYGSLRTFFNIVRSIEALVWAIIFSVWVGIGPFAGMLALMVHSIASLAKQFSEIIESVERGPIEGVQATGANAFQVVWFAVVPQVTLPFVSFAIYRWDINVRMATIIGFVGGGGIGQLLIQYQGQAQWSEVGCLIFVIALVVWFMDMASAHLREALK